jgi:hypothetical protein
MAKALKTVTVKANRFDLSQVTVAWYAFSDSRDNFISVGKAALAAGIKADDLLSHIRAVHVHKCLGGSAADYDAGKVRDILALPGFDTKNPDDKKRSASQEAAVKAAKVQVSRVRGALGLIAPGKANAPEANAKQIARRKAEQAANAVKAQSDLAAPKHSNWQDADASFMALADMLEQRVKQNAGFVRGRVARIALGLVTAIREECKAVDA